MVNNREDIEECFLKCSTETRQSFMAALQMVYDEVFEINPYDDCVYILNSRYDTAMCGMTVCYSDFFWEYVDAMVYLYDCEEFISDFEPEALRKFAESEDMKQEKKFVRLRTDTNKKEWYIATLIKNPADKRRIILLMKNENEVCINEMQKKAIMEDYDYVIGINIQNEKISIYSNNEAKYGHSTLYNVFYEKFLNQRIKKYVLSEYAEKISEKMQLIRPLADKKHLEFDTDYKKLRFENVVGDAKRIRQLCINLLSNAVKYTEDGGKIYFSISERGVVKEETDNIYMEYEIIVKDNGIGISEEFMPYLFEMFEREKKVLGENISGTGLGMTIARNLARLMDGDIYVESKENEGTKFSVTLRLRLPAPDESVTTDDINMGISGGVIRF